MKKKSIALALSALMVTGLVGCGNSSEGENKAESTLKVGMVTDSGTIDDKSFNQGTWEGIGQAEEELGIEKNYLKPSGETEVDYLTEIQNLYDADFKFIVCPGFKFETAIYEAQQKYSDAKFVLIDASPSDGNGNGLVADNTVSIFFAEQEAGFAAGVAAAVELQTGDLGFVGGMETGPVKRFDAGFQQGVAYANEKYGTSVSLKDENIVYSGSFTDKALGQQLAATMYDRGVKAIFAAAGGTGTGVITEAKTREGAWVIGVDSDQYSEVIKQDGTSVILTSAVKKVEKASYNMVQAELNGEFPGGQTLILDAANGGVGIPAENPNLSEETVKKVNEVLEAIKNGEIEVKEEL